MSKEKKKKDPKVKLPRAWSSKKGGDGGGRGGGGGRAGDGKIADSVWTFVLTIFVIALILFIFLGGINQRKTIGWFYDFSKNVGEKFTEWFKPENIEVNDDGVYYRPDGVKPTDADGKVIETSATDSEETTAEESNSDKTEETKGEK
jgi:hypothetical protein